MPRIRMGLAVAFTAVLLGLCAGAPRAAALGLVKVDLPGRSIGFTPRFVGKDFGILEKNGITVAFVHLAGNALPAAGVR